MLPVFQDKVTAVQTVPDWYDELQALQERMESYGPAVNAKTAEDKDDLWENKIKHMPKNYKPSEWGQLKGSSNAGYH